MCLCGCGCLCMCLYGWGCGCGAGAVRACVACGMRVCVHAECVMRKGVREGAYEALCVKLCARIYGWAHLAGQHNRATAIPPHLTNHPHHVGEAA